MMKAILTEKDTCPRCLKKFHCGKGGKCWCFEVDVPVSVLEIINTKFDGCLCPECLNQMAANQAEH